MADSQSVGAAATEMLQKISLRKSARARRLSKPIDLHRFTIGFVLVLFICV